MIREVAGNVAGHGGVIVNPAPRAISASPTATWSRSRRRSARRAAASVLRQGIRPDTLLLVGQFDHWATPFAKDFGVPSLNALATMSLTTDATGSGADIVRGSQGGGYGMTRWAMVADLRAASAARPARGVQARQRDAARRPVAARARHGVRRVPRRPARVRAHRLPALRRPPCMDVCPTTATRKRPTASSPSTTTCASAAPTARSPAPPGALQDRPRRLCLRPGDGSETSDRDERLAVATSAPSASTASTPDSAGQRRRRRPEATPACVNAVHRQALVFGDSDDPDATSRLLRDAALPHARGAGAPGRASTCLGHEVDAGGYGPNPVWQAHWDWRAAATSSRGARRRARLGCRARRAARSSRRSPGWRRGPGPPACGRDRPPLRAARVLQPADPWMTREASSPRC